MRTNRTQPLDYAPRVEFEVRKRANEVMIYKRVEGRKPQLVVLTIAEWEKVKNVCEGVK